MIYGRTKKFFTHITVFLIIVFSTTLMAANNGTIVLVRDGNGELQKLEKQIAIKLWDNYFTKSVNNYSVTSTITTIDKFIRHLYEWKTDYVLLEGSSFIQYYHLLEPKLIDEAWLAQRTENNFEEFVLLVRKDAKIDSFRQLRNSVFSLHSGYGLLQLYLEQLVNETSNSSMTDFFKKIRDTKTESLAILDVYFSKSDACLVAKHVLDNAIDLNPAIGKKIKIIQHSKRIFAPLIYLALNDATKNDQQNFSRAIEMLNNTVRGRQFLDLFGVHTIKRIDFRKLKPMLGQSVTWQK
jgi:hypothetical protein